MRGEPYVPHFRGIVRIKIYVQGNLLNRLIERYPPILNVLAIHTKYYTNAGHLQGMIGVASSAVEEHHIARFGRKRMFWVRSIDARFHRVLVWPRVTENCDEVSRLVHLLQFYAGSSAISQT